eukprot:CAMPEP_0201523648 /NCGR_PEP_ID=MMETSP0161_2-20130828/20684_1 /ASSEMBLY_ACC=CAM_ASM_000251 /TAXON_ID=180227 /ORGANISM="Neoparamoeba aestuarina, Strain SoJaBio B1-5/56/2" /LENGTH=309 /DNA_ID=CAMNT_0047922833 /DNA_START=67 /DNA_END=996 /DNA_ORIENTATION=+
MAAGNPIYKYLHSLKASEIGSSADITLVKDQQPLEEVVNLFAEKKITSAPCVSSDGAVLGYIDMLDIVTYIVSVSPDKWCLDHQQLQSLETAGRAISCVAAEEIKNASGRDPYVPVYETDPATECITHFANGVHRICIVDSSGTPKHSFSQSDMAKLLSEELKKSHSKAISAKSIKELGLGCWSTPVTCGEKDTVLKALEILSDKKISALAVVKENGTLSANFSATDLVGLYRKQLPDLLMPVNDYLTKYSEKATNPVTIRHDTSLLQAVQTMAEEKIHRVWVIDDDFKPVGVVSLTDVAGFIKLYVEE